MGFQERNAWACGCFTLAAFTPYFWLVFGNPMAYATLFTIAVFGLVVLLIGFHSVNSMASDSIRKSGDVPAQDELDRIIEFRAAKLAGIVLATVVLIWAIAAMVGVPAEGFANTATASSEGVANASDFAIPATKVMCWVHLLFAGFVISNVTYYGGIVAGYRRLTNG